jgi:hypothetical protein
MLRHGRHSAFSLAWTCCRWHGHLRSAFATTPTKFPPAFGIDLRIGDAEGVRLEGERHGFRVLVVQPNDRDWFRKILAAVDLLSSAQAAQRISFGSDTMDERLVTFAENAIRAYLAEHPQSADTLEGVHRWWITWPGLSAPEAVTLAALERLEATGELETVSVAARILWRRKKT